MCGDHQEASVNLQFVRFDLGCSRVGWGSSQHFLCCDGLPLDRGDDEGVPGGVFGPLGLDEDYLTG